MQIKEEILNFLNENGVADAGFTNVDDGPFGENSGAVSIVVKLSDAVIDEIGSEPTHTYFHHYRTVNAFVDRICLQIGFILERHGYRYIAVPASQSINKDGWNYCGRYSHKKIAVMSGLGGIGKNDLFLHREYGPRVRLGTVFTDCVFDCEEIEGFTPCRDCDLCVKACPAGALKGVLRGADTERSDIIDPEKCSNYMKKQFQHIGRGAVCGICIRVCPAGSPEMRKKLYGTEKN